jgi:hypothetical protein
MNWLGISEPSAHSRYRSSEPLVRLTQEQSFHAGGYQGERIRKILLNSDIEHRRFYLEGGLNCEESSDQLPRDSELCKAAGTALQDVDFLAVCTSTGYVCPDVGSRLVARAF